MSLDILLIVVGGLAAIVSGGLLALLAPGGAAPLLAGAALGSLGLLQLGLARAVYELSRTGGVAWFELTLPLALLVSLLWVLFSTTLGRADTPRATHRWRLYFVAQTLLAIGSLVLVSGKPLGTPPRPSADPTLFGLHAIDFVLLGAIQCNLILFTASFEATYLSLLPKHRRSFMPALIAALVGAGSVTYLILLAFLRGTVDADDLSLGAAPVVAVSILLPISLIRGRAAEVRIGRSVRPVTSTLSVTLAFVFLAGAAALLWLSGQEGMSLGRGLWTLAIAAAAVVIGGLAASNRLRRRARDLLDPILATRRIARHEVRARIEEALSGVRATDELRAAIPRSLQDLAGVGPVTLFLADRPAHVFRPVTSTLETLPRTPVEEGTPLVKRLRRRRHAIRLLGNSDDLGLIPFYVEHASQITECRALCAVPLLGEERLIGFLLCGGQGEPPRILQSQLALLDQAAQIYALRLRSLRLARLDTGATVP